MNAVASITSSTDREPVLENALAGLWAQAGLHDHNGGDPAALVRPLVEAGLFKCVVPAPDGTGLATDAGEVMALHDLLRRIGAANLSAGRLFEGHVNAVKLVFAHGDDEQKAQVLNGVIAGDLMGVWNAEAPPGVRLERDGDGLILRGSKIYASGVGLIHRPLITARDSNGGVYITAPRAALRAPFDLSGWRMRGMRATATGTIHLDGVRVDRHEIIGAPGDYYRSPGFRGGAWRFAAVQLGALEQIARLMTLGLKARGRDADPHQKARAGDVEIALQTARLWTRHAAHTVEKGKVDPAEADACAGMARLVVERASLEVIELAERALGLMAFAEAEPIERIVRDLSTYLRQPFPDAVLEGVGEWTLGR